MVIKNELGYKSEFLRFVPLKQQEYVSMPSLFRLALVKIMFENPYTFPMNTDS